MNISLPVEMTSALGFDIGPPLYCSVEFRDTRQIEHERCYAFTGKPIYQDSKSYICVFRIARDSNEKESAPLQSTRVPQFDRSADRAHKVDREA